MTATSAESLRFSPGTDSIMSSIYTLPAWKKELLERKAKNEKLKKQADMRMARSQQSNQTQKWPAGSSYSDNSPHGSALDTTTATSAIRPPTPSRQAEIFSPQPYVKPKLRNSTADDASVLEEAVVKVKENPFKLMEKSSAVPKAFIRGRTPEKYQYGIVTPAPQKSFIPPVNAAISNDFENRSGDSSLNTSLNTSKGSVSGSFQVASANYDQNIHSHTSTPTPPLIMRNSPSGEFIQPYLSSPREPNIHAAPRPNISVSKYHQHSPLLPVNSAEFEANISSRSSRQSPISNSVPLSHAPIVPTQIAPNMSEVDEMPAPNTVSNLKNVYEKKHTLNSSPKPFKPRLRDPTPPPPAFRKSAPAPPLVKSQVTHFPTFSKSSVEKDDRPTATVKPVVQNRDSVQDNVKANDNDTREIIGRPFKEVHSRKDRPIARDLNYTSSTICIQTYDPKFVHEYASHRITSLLNSIIRESMTYKVIPSAVKHHDPVSVITNHSPAAVHTKESEVQRVVINKVHKQAPLAPPAAFAPAENDLKPLSSFLYKTPSSPEPPTQRPNSRDLTLPFNTEVSESEKLDASAHLFDSLTDDIEAQKSHKVSPSPLPVEMEDPNHPRLVVFQPSNYGKRVDPPTTVTIVPREENPRSSELIQVQLGEDMNLVTSFKDPNEPDPSPLFPADTTSDGGSHSQAIARAQGSPDSQQPPEDTVIVVVQPPHPSLKSCINQKGKTVGNQIVSMFRKCHLELNVACYFESRAVHFQILAEPHCLITQDNRTIFQSPRTTEKTLNINSVVD